MPIRRGGFGQLAALHPAAQTPARRVDVYYKSGNASFAITETEKPAKPRSIPARVSPCESTGPASLSLYSGRRAGVAPDRWFMVGDSYRRGVDGGFGGNWNFNNRSEAPWFGGT